ncbi:MAG: SDR family oxidoreductase, partial [Alphaproteobacteria bacterium]
LVVPGLIETEQLAEYKKRYSIAEGLAEIPLGALGTPQDIAEWVVFLSTGRARYATGATIDVGGASYMH